MSRIQRLIRNLVRHRHVEQDLDDEVASHFELLVDEHCAGGMDEAEARRAARSEMGSHAQIKEAVRDIRMGAWFEELWRDVRHGARGFRREPGFTAITVLSLALGIGSTTSLFSVTYGVLLRPLPWPDASRLVRITETRRGHLPRVAGTMSNGPYLTWSANHASIEAIGGWIRPTASMLTIGTGDPLQIQTMAVTPSLFTVLKTVPLTGRTFIDDDGSSGGAPQGARAIILSYGLWQETFGGSADAIGRAVQLDGRAVTIVGVMPPSFAFPDRGTRAWTPWVPPIVIGDNVIRMSIFSALARLRPGVTYEQASAEGTARARAAPDPGLTAVALFGANGPAEIQVTSAIGLMTAEVRPALLILLGAVTLLLVTATANVAMLQLARATARRRELAIRSAIGAGAARLTRQLIVESAMFGLGGGVAGIVLTIILHRILPSMLPPDFPRVDAVAVDWRILLFASLISIAASVLCSLLPSWHARRVDLVALLSEDASAPAGGGMATRTGRARALLMAAQLAMSCVLLVGAALLTRSFVALLHTDRGYNPTNVMTARVTFPPDVSQGDHDLSGRATLERRKAMLEHVVERLQALPGVRAAAYGNALPLLTVGGFRGFKMRLPIDPSVEVEVNVVQRVVSPGYSDALGLRLIAGRAIIPTDTMTSPNVVVVNRSFATKYLGANPIGATVPSLGMCRGNNDRWEVVGVVEDMRQGALVDQPQAELFLPASQVGCATALATGVVVLRTAADPLPYANSVRAIVREQDSSVAIDSIMTMEDRVATALARPRLYAVVLAGFAGAAVVIAGVGLFGVLSYTVAQRSREIGVRTALGARPGHIIGLVLRQLAVVAGAGIFAGLLAAFLLSRLLRTALYGFDPHDVVSFAVVALTVCGIAVLACVVPAQRAARIDPLQIMR